MAGLIEIMEFLRRLWRSEGHTVVIVTHEMPIVAAYAERVVALAQGRVLPDGPTREVFARPDVLRRTFVKPPQATRLAQAWSEFGVRRDALDVDELEESVISVLRRPAPPPTSVRASEAEVDPA